MSKLEHNSKIIKGMSWEIVTKFIIQIASWSSAIVVARILDPSDYGLVATSGVFIGFLLLISDFGVAQGLINKSKVTNEECNVVFWLSMLVSILLFLLIFYLAPYIAGFYKEPILSDIIRVSAFMLVFGSLKIIPTVLLMREMNFKYSALVQLVSQGGVIITVLVLANLGAGVWSLVCSVLVGQVIQVLAYVPMMSVIGKIDLNYVKVKGVINFGVKIMLSKLFAYSSNQSGTAIIGVEFGQKKLGYYDLANVLALMPLDKIGSIFNKVAFPAISKIKSDTEYALEIFLVMHKYLLLVSIPIFSIVALSAEEIVLILFTEKWLPMVPLLEMMAIMNIFRISGMLMPNLLAGLGRPGEVLIYQGLSAVLMPTFIVIGVSWGVEGAVFAMLILHPMLYTYLLYRVVVNLQTTFFKVFYSVWQILVSTLIMTLVIAVLKHSMLDMGGIVGMLLLVIVAMLVYLSSLLILNKGLISEVKNGLRLLRAK